MRVLGEEKMELIGGFEIERFITEAMGRPWYLGQEAPQRLPDICEKEEGMGLRWDVLASTQLGSEAGRPLQHDN